MTERTARLTGLAIAVAVIVPGLFFAQQVTFRSGVDLVAVDAQVVDRDGTPIGNLATSNFDVWINGQARKVVSADLIQYPLASPRSLALSPLEAPGTIARTDLPPVSGRVIVLAVDEVSFSTAAMAQAVQTAKRFIANVPPDDVIALYSYPFGGGRLELTHFHNQVSLGLNRLQGFKQSMAGSFDLSPSEAIDIAANDTNALYSVYARECLVQVGSNCVDKDALWQGGGDNALSAASSSFSAKDVTKSACITNIKGQARDYAMYIEQMSAESFAGLSDLLKGLASVGGPKTVVLLSAGVLSSDRVGGRPDATSMMNHAGQLAAAANATLYAMHMDGSFQEINSASGHQVAFNPCQTKAGGALSSNARDGELAASGLERIAGAAGGQYFRVTAGSGDTFFKRVLEETSAYYVLGVQPEDVDRDGKTHFIRVKTVDVKNATVRFRTQVMIPRLDPGR
jgi:VWFA-related protein